MSWNKYKPQVCVLAEDDANRQILQGFRLELSLKPRAIHEEPVAGGWPAIRDSFEKEYNRLLRQYPLCLMVLLVDFDDQGARRFEDVLSGVDATLRDRVFVLGVKSEPERLKTALGMSFEQIGKTLAKECSEGTSTTWESELLAHNHGELNRMLPRIKKVLFG